MVTACCSASQIVFIGPKEEVKAAKRLLRKETYIQVQPRTARPTITPRTDIPSIVLRNKKDAAAMVEKVLNFYAREKRGKTHQSDDFRKPRRGGVRELHSQRLEASLYENFFDLF